MSWVLVRWKPRDGDSRMPKFRNMYDIMPKLQWLNVPTMKRNAWEVVTTTNTEDEAVALMKLMPNYNDEVSS